MHEHDSILLYTDSASLVNRNLYICLLIYMFTAIYFTFYIHNVVYTNIIFIQHLSLHVWEEFLEILSTLKFSSLKKT
jgi:hypothetical protein